MRFKVQIFILLMIIGSACNSENRKGIPIITGEYSIKDLTETELDIYEVNSGLTVLFDTLIDKTIDCDLYKNLPFWFIFESYQDSIGDYAGLCRI
jgi:hypothetical protein